MKQSLIAGFSVCALVLGAHAKSLRDYVAAFNAADEELYTNAVPNAAAAAFAGNTSITKPSLSIK